MIHTELFTQYIANNGGAEKALPSLFDKVPNIVTDSEVTTFKDAFVLNFCDREIGFETEQLFALKLESRAKLVLPRYINKLVTLGDIDYLNAHRSETETRNGSGSVTDSGNDTTTKNGSESVQDSGSDTVTHETSGNVQDSGNDKNTRFKGENPLIDTTLSFNANAITEQELATIEYGKKSATTGSGTDSTQYGKKSEGVNSEINKTDYGKVTNSKETGETKREYTDGELETYDLYERVLNESVNVWAKIFSEFDSLFMQVW